jgi:hypothetical protein
MKRYVQHTSGQGPTWEVAADQLQFNVYTWLVRVYLKPMEYVEYVLPQSEYVEVPAPEVWTDVTKDVMESAEQDCHDLLHQGMWLGMAVRRGYRLRKVACFTKELPCSHWAFVIERRKP